MISPSAVRRRCRFIVTPGPRPDVFPKVRTPDEVRWLDDLLTERGHPTRLHMMIETSAGLEAVHDIPRASARIEVWFCGGVDMAAELRRRNAREPLQYACSRVVRAAETAGVDGIEVPFLDLDGAARDEPNGGHCRKKSGGTGLHGRAMQKITRKLPAKATKPAR